MKIKTVIMISAIMIIIFLTASFVITLYDADFNVNNLIRMPVKGNVVLDEQSLHIDQISVEDNYVYIKGGINHYGYIITDVKCEKVKDTLYIKVYGGYGVSDDLKKLTVEKQFDGEVINRIVLKVNFFKSKILWNSRDGIL